MLVLKILSHVHKCVTSNYVILHKSVFSNHELSGAAGMRDDKYFPKMQCRMTAAALSTFGPKTKIAVTGVRSIVSHKTTYLVLLT